MSEIVLAAVEGIYNWKNEVHGKYKLYLLHRPHQGGGALFLGGPSIS